MWQQLLGPQRKINMMKIAILTIILAFSVQVSPHTNAADAPHELAGFRLGGKIADYRHLIKFESILPVRYLESLKEAEIKDIKGFKTGFVYYGTCMQPPRIGRLKFKYADYTNKFYDALLKRFKAHFGEPDQWRGDPFHIVLAWKWSFTDRDGNDISLILQHNIRDEEEKQGNSIKMTMWNLMKAEDRCFQDKSGKPQKDSLRHSQGLSIDWDRFIPR
jgi:hypothetical protein